MGEVYLARDPRLEREMAINVLPEGSRTTTFHDIAPDGEHFLMVKRLDAEVVVVVNWLEEVRRLFERAR